MVVEVGAVGVATAALQAVAIDVGERNREAEATRDDAGDHVGEIRCLG